MLHTKLGKNVGIDGICTKTSFNRLNYSRYFNCCNFCLLSFSCGILPLMIKMLIKKVGQIFYVKTS